MTSTQSSTRFVAVAAGIALALSLVLAPAIAPAQAAGLSQTQISSILSLLSSFGADQATINNVNAALNGQATTGTGSGTGTSGACPALSRSLQVGSSGADVMALQVFLNSNASTQIAASGAGSPGSESTYFGGLTKTAVIKFQTANGVSAIGIVGPATRAAIAAVCGKGTTGGTGGTTGGNGTGSGTLTVSAGAQPVNSLAPKGASRVPFTTFTLSNNSSAAVMVNSVTVQRAGLAQDAAFSGVVLLDSNGLQIGNAKTFNSNHQANVGDTGFTLQPGASMTFTVAGNMATDETSYSGQVAALQVVAVNTSATVSGSLPISGASQTINNTLSVGSFSTSTSGVVSPTSSNHNQNVGDVGVRFAGLKFTASSAEDLKLYSIRWRQVGSGSNVDVSNVVTFANGTSYPTTVDSTGKYYTTVFPGGILIPKGNNVDVYVQGDLTGSNSAGRTVQFTIDRATDVYFVGQLYGYGINDTVKPNAQPWFTGDQFTILAGTASTISKSTAAADAAQNVAVNVPNQPLGGFSTNFLGEPVTISGMTITVASTTSGTAVSLPLTSVSITDDNGAVVAGPVDQSSNNKLVFTDSVTFPTGTHTYHVRGKIASGVTNNSTFTLNVDPTTWTNPTGQVTGNSVSITNTNFNLNQMTVMGATTTINVSSNPSAQNVVAGTQGFTFANIQLDATQSGEDVRFSSLPVSFTGTNTPAAQLSGCQLFDGATALTSGSRVINNLTVGQNSFSFDNSLVVPKGTVKTISVVCNISSGATIQTFQFGINSTYSYSASGVTSGVSITPNVTTATGGIMTVAAGSLTVTSASSAVAQPSLVRAPAGTTGVTIGNIKLRATNEALNLQKLGLTLAGGNGKYGSKSTGSGGSTSSGAGDLIQVTIYNGSTIVGTATFAGSNTVATSTLTSPVTLTKDQDTILTIKADLAQIGVSSSGGIGDIVTVDPLNAEATGASSGTTVKTGATAGVNGVQMSKSVPTVAAGSVTSCTNNTSCNGASQVLKSFTVKADAAGPVSVEQVSIAIATSSANLTNVLVRVLDNNGNVSTSTFGTQQCTPGGCSFNTTGTLTFTGGPVIIPANTAYTFQVIGDVAATGNSTWSVTAKLNGDAAQIANIGSSPTYIATSTSVANSSNFVWSDNATTTASLTDVDWFNGYQVSGLPSTGL